MLKINHLFGRYFHHMSPSAHHDNAKTFTNDPHNMAPSVATVTVTTSSGPPTKKRTKPESETYNSAAQTRGGTSNYSSTAVSKNGEAGSGLSPPKICKDSPMNWSGSSMQFSEIRSLKRVHKVEEGIGTDNIVESLGILHPSTGEVLTVGDAISLRILDVRTGRIATSPDGRSPTVSIEEAAARGLVDPALAERLLGPCGIVEDDGGSGRQLSLLEAIQRELFDAERGLVTSAEGQVKVMYTSGEDQPKRISIAEAIAKGMIHPETGQFTNPGGGEQMTLKEAFVRNLIDRDPKGEKGKKKSSTLGISLSDAISQGLVDDHSGQVVDRNSGDKYPLAVAIKRGIIDPSVREIVDASADNKVTVSEAIASGILDPKHGKYIHGLSQEILPLREARRRKLIVKPLTLKDCCDLELIDNTGKIFSPLHRNRLPLLECISRGVLDSDSVKSITDTTTDDLLTLSEALAEEIILPEGKFRDASTGEIFTIPEAVNRGLITSVSVKSIFDIDGFKDPVGTDFVSLNAAIAKGALSMKTGAAMFVVDPKLGKTISIDQAAKQNLVRPEVLEMLSRKIGIRDRGRELTVLEAVAKCYLDPKTGHLLDPKDRKPLPLDEAVRRRLITPEGAALLGSLLAITVTTQTVTKTIKRYVTITSSGVTTSDVKMTFGEAIRQGLIDETNQTFRDPDTGRVLSVQDAMNERLIGFASSESSPNCSPIRQRTSGSTSPTKSPGGSAVKARSPGSVSPVKEKYSERGQPIAKGYGSSNSSPIKERKFDHSPVESPVKGRSPAGSPVKEKLGFDMTVCKGRATLSGKGRTSPGRGSSPVKQKLQQYPAEDVLDFSHVCSSQSPTLGIVPSYEADSAEFLASERQAAMQKQVFELPPDGWYLSEAIEQRLFDPVTGLFIIPGTDRLVSFEECVKLEIINPTSALVIDPNNGRKISLIRSLEKRVLDGTGHYASGGKKLPMKEAIAKNFIILEGRMEHDHTSSRLIQVTKITGKPDLVELSDVGSSAGNPPTFREIKSSEVDVSTLEPLQVAPGIIYDPATALVIFTESGKADNLLAAVKEGKIEPRMVKVKDPYTGKSLNINEAMRKGIVDKETGDYKDKAGRKISLAEAAKFGVLAVVGSPLVAAVKSVKVPKNALVADPNTGEDVPIEVAYERGLIDDETLRRFESATEHLVEGTSPEQVVTTKTEIVSTSVVIQDPATGKEITAQQAIEKGLLTSEDLKQLTAAAQDGLESGRPVKTLSTTTIPLDDDDRPSAGERTRGRVTTEPKFRVAIGRARSFSQSPEREAKPVVLQKMRKKVVKPCDAIETGMIDKETADMLEKPEVFKGSDGESLSLAEAVSCNKLDGNKGAILDPQRGDVLTIKEAMDRGILDPAGPSGRLLVPIARSLSVPGLLEQGLMDPDAKKIVHPETGTYLSLREAIVCEIVDPLSKMVEPSSGNIVTLEEAIAKGYVDEDKSLIKTPSGSVDLLTAAQDMNMFEKSSESSVKGLPPAGMTFPVALRRGLVDPVTKEILHPITGIRIPVEKAIEDDFIMALPYPVSPFSIEVTQALDCNLIDGEKGTFKNPKTGEVVPVSEAVESGILVIKPVPQLITLEPSGTVTAVTETVTSYHTITTKTIELKHGYILIGPDQVRYTQTGEVLSLDEARRRGIVKDESETKEEFTTREIKMSFSDAIAQGYVDLDAGTYTNPATGEIMSISEAIKDGLLDTTMPTQISEDPTKSPAGKKVKKLNPVEAVDALYEEKTRKFRDPNSPAKNYTFKEALDKGIIDSEAVIYDVVSGKPVTTREAVEKGIIDPRTGRVKDTKTGISVNVKEAAKLGLLAVVGAPVLAGVAVVDAVKGLKDKKSTAKSSQQDSYLKEETSSSRSLLFQETPVTPSRKSHLKSPECQKSPMKPSEKEKSPVITIKTKARTPSPVKDTLNGSKMPLREAIYDRHIEPESCSITVPTSDGKEEQMSVQDALDKNAVALKDVVEVFNKAKVGLVDEKMRYKVKVTKHLNAENLANDGVYNLDSNSFVDPMTGETIRFEDLVLRYDVFDPDLIEVKDLASYPETYVTLREALEVPVIDKVSGHMVDPRTGKRVPFFEAVKLGWIVEKPGETKLTKVKPHPSLTFQEAIDEGLYDPKTGDIQDPKTGDKFSFAEALTSGVLDPVSVSIRNPENDDILPLSEAVEIGIVDLNRGVIVNVETRTEVEFKVAFLQGYVVAGPRKPVSLEAVIKKGLYNPKTGMITDPLTKQAIDVEESVKRGLVDAFVTECKDTRADAFVSLDDALSTKLVNPKTGKLRNTANGNLMTLDVALSKGLIVTNKFSVTLIEAIVQEYYSPCTGRVSDPVSGDELTVQEAIELGFVDCSSVRVKDSHQDKIVTVRDATAAGLLNTQKGILTYPAPMTLDIAFEKGYILTTRKPWSLQEALAQSCYDPKTGLMVMNGDGERMTLDEAMKRGEINRDALTVKDPRSGDIITLGEAIKIGVIDPKLGTAADPTNGAEMHFYDALERGLIVPAKRKFSLPEAVFKGFYDPKSGKFTSPETREKLPTDRAIKRGIIDPASTLVKTSGGKVTTFDSAVEEGFVDSRAGTIAGAGQFGRRLDFQEAFEQGLLIEVRRPMSLSEALLKGVFDEEKGQFLDPSSGDYLTLADAIEKNLIDSDSVHVKDTRSGFWKKVSLAEAIRLGFVDGETAKVKDFTRGNLEVTVSEAFDLGLIVDSKAAVSIQRAIHQGLYDDSTGKLTDPNTGRKITLHEAIRRFIINPQLPCYWDKKSERLLSLVETCRAGIIDRRAGTFREPGANCTIYLSDAMELGLIVDIESAGFGLYEAIAMGLYDADSGRFIHPSTGRKLMLSDACKGELINPLTSIVKHCKSGRYCKLSEATEADLIDEERGVYKIPDSKKTLTLKEAKEKGLIVTSKKPLSIEEAVRNGLYRPDTGRFTDPDVGDQLDIAQALVHGLIDANTTALKDPATGQLKSVNSGIEDGSVDVPRGCVVDPKTKRAYTIDAALERGLLVTVERPITFQQAVRRGSIDFQRCTFKDPRTMRECTLEEAIRYELIDPESAVVKDPQTGRFRTLKKAITDGVIDMNKRAAFDPQTGKVKPLCIIFDQGTVVFLREPLTFDAAVEQGHLNVVTGKFIDPQSKEVLTLKETVSLGLIDPDSALIKDSTKKKLVKLPEAFRKGLMDAEKGNVLDSETSRLYSLSAAIESGLLTTPRRGLSLIEGLQFGLYNPTTGGFTDPFFSSGVIDRRRLRLEEAIDSGLIDPSTTVVKDADSGNISSLTDAISVSKIVDAVAGRMLETSTGKSIDLLKAHDKGYILTAEARVSTLLMFHIFMQIIL